MYFDKNIVPVDDNDIENPRIIFKNLRLENKDTKE